MLFFVRKKRMRRCFPFQNSSVQCASIKISIRSANIGHIGSGRLHADVSSVLKIERLLRIWSNMFGIGNTNKTVTYTFEISSAWPMSIDVVSRSQLKLVCFSNWLWLSHLTGFERFLYVKRAMNLFIGIFICLTGVNNIKFILVSVLEQWISILNVT